MAQFRNPVGNFTFETLVAFIGVLLVFPLLIRLVFGTLRTIFSLGFVRRLIVDSLVVGATALLTREDVLDKLFGQKGRQGDGLLKPDVDR